jgi:hypothetical protein
MNFARIFALCLAAASFTSAKEPVRVELRFESVRGLMLVKARMGEREGTFIFDTGAETTLADREFLKLKREEKSFDANAPGAKTLRPAKVSPACLGAACVEHATVGVAEFGEASRGLGREIDGILGQDVLREFDCVAIDYKRGVIVLTKNGGE